MAAGPIGGGWPRLGVSPAALSLAPALILFSLFVLWPAIGNIYFSFTDYLGTSRNVRFIGLANYQRAFTSDWPIVSAAIGRSLVFAAGVTVAQNIMAVFLAVLLNLKIRLRSFHRMIIFLPTILGVTVIGLSWRLILNPIFGPLNRLLAATVGRSGLLGDPEIALTLLIGIQIWAAVGYSMVIYLAGLQTIAEELYEAADIEGANTTQKLFRITLPLLAPAVTINVLLGLIGSLKLFQIILITTGGGPGRATTTLSLMVFQELAGSVSGSLPNLGYSAALSVVHFALMFVVIAIAQVYLRRREDRMS